MLPLSLARKLARAANADTIAIDASQAFAGFYGRLADALADAGCDDLEAEGIAREVVAGVVRAFENASHAMTRAVVASAEAARSAPRH
ncbi:hypothetical protein [Variovorax rhizosphaerae]|uniref:DUF5610 domain-containing protein n=1 Tax=Variovorax rhizosphaerae TaxID=1836200 RepID=A0ABU8WJU9_9BURK